MRAVGREMTVAYKVAAGFAGKRRSAGSRFEEEPVKNPWEPYRLKIFPKKINEHWYAPGDMVYRKFVFSPGGGYWVYGDDFDFIRGT